MLERNRSRLDTGYFSPSICQINSGVLEKCTIFECETNTLFHRTKWEKKMFFFQFARVSIGNCVRKGTRERTRRRQKKVEKNGNSIHAYSNWPILIYFSFFLSQILIMPINFHSSAFRRTPPPATPVSTSTISERSLSQFAFTAIAILIPHTIGAGIFSIFCTRRFECDGSAFFEFILFDLRAFAFLLASNDEHEEKEEVLFHSQNNAVRIKMISSLFRVMEHFERAVSLFFVENEKLSRDRDVEAADNAGWLTGAGWANGVNREMKYIRNAY